MTQYTYLTDLAYVYLGLLGAFSLAQLLLIGPRNRVHIFLWIGASAFSAIGTAFAPHLLTVVSVANFGVWGGLAALLGGILRFFALSFRQRTFHRNPAARMFFWFAMLGMPLASMPQLSPYRLLVSSLVGASISAACFLAMLNNPVWRFRSRLSLHLTLIGMGISCVVLTFRAATSYPFGPDQIFVGESELQRRAFETLVLISFFLQVGFTGMIIARRDLEGLFADRRAVRLAQRTIRMRKRNAEIARTSQQRLDLVQLLTHEVRQPINNAQASLQSISLNLQASRNTPAKATIALDRAQSSLDYITLALSNIIVASTLVADERKWAPQEIDALTILEMALLDCRPEDRARIVAREADQHIYLAGVPILLRVALQNILEHAIKLSRPGSEIEVQLSVDPGDQLVVFDVRFISDRTSEFHQGLFERRRSNDTDRSEISPLGLFVVRQVARELGGEVRLSNTQSDQLSFQLALPY